jgi:hypothetical protein
MRPKGKLFALFAVFAAIGLVTASGAFTTVTAERTVSVQTAGDANALLGLDGNSSSGNGDYVTTENGQLVIDLSDPGDNSATGVNVNATTNISNMINVSNRGTQDINFYVTTTNNNDEVDLVFYDGSGSNITTSGNSITIGSGNNASVGLQIVTDESGPSNSDLNETVTFHAESQ